MVTLCGGHQKPFMDHSGIFPIWDGAESTVPHAFLWLRGRGRCIRDKIAIAKRVFSPDPARSRWRRNPRRHAGRSGAVMIDGKMQDDATWKQAKVVYDLRCSSPPRSRSSGALRTLNLCGRDSH